MDEGRADGRTEGRTDGRVHVQDGNGKNPFDAAKISKADSVQKHATQTVLHTYCLMMACDSIPAMTSQAERKKESLFIVKDFT